jgi:hypothetical protein
MKYHESATSLAASSIFIVTDILGDIAEGAGPSERIGRKIWIRKINMRMELHTNGLPDSDSTSPVIDMNLCRVIIGIDHQCNGALIGAGSIVENTGNWWSFRSLEDISRCTILFDRFFVVGGGAFSTADSVDNKVYGQAVDMFIPYNKVCNIPIEYSGSTGIISQRKTNNLFAAYICRSVPAPNTATTPTPTIYFNTRYRYYG